MHKLNISDGLLRRTWDPAAIRHYAVWQQRTLCVRVWLKDEINQPCDISVKVSDITKSEDLVQYKGCWGNTLNMLNIVIQDWSAGISDLWGSDKKGFYINLSVTLLRKRSSTFHPTVALWEEPVIIVFVLKWTINLLVCCRSENDSEVQQFVFVAVVKSNFGSVLDLVI